MAKTYLITGGTGLIGQAFIASLPIESTKVTVVTRNVNKARALLGEHVHIIETISLADIEQSDVVLNLAGEPIADKRWSGNQKNKICQSRWTVTRKLAELIKRADSPPNLFISGSAIGIYGRQGKVAIDESFETFHKEFTHEVCAEWEDIASSVASNKTRVAMLRTGVVLSNVGGAMSKMILPFKLGLGGKIGDGSQIMSWIHIDDMISAIHHIVADNSLSGAMNFTAPNPVSNVRFSQALAKQLNRPCLFTTPAWLLRTIFGEMSDILLFGQNVIPHKLESNGFKFKYRDIESAFADLYQR